MALEDVANHYLKNYVNKGEDPHPDAQRLFGLKQNRGTGEWYHDPTISQLGRTYTLSDDARIPIKSRVWKDEYDEEGNVKKSPFISRGLRISRLLYQPDIVCGFGDGSVFNQSPEAKAYCKENCSGGYHTPSCSMDKRKIGQYFSTDGNAYEADPVHFINMSHLRMLGGIAGLIRRKEFNADSFVDLMKKASQVTHGRGNRNSDPTSDGRRFHGLRKGGIPLFLQNHINGLMRNVPDYYELDEDSTPVALRESHRQRINELATANYVKCFCPFCSIERGKNLGNAIFDVQHHVEAGTSSVPGIRESYFHVDPGKKSFGFSTSDFPFGRGKPREFGAHGMLFPHRVLLHSRDLEKTIRHYAKHDSEERGGFIGWLRPRTIRIGDMPTRVIGLSPEAIAQRIRGNPDVSGLPIDEE